MISHALFNLRAETKCSGAHYQEKMI